jgi:Ca2+-binding RTX toxin-like protein
LFGGAGIDTFILRIGDGGDAVGKADVIEDFQDGTDTLKLVDDLQISDLTFMDGSGSHAGNTFILHASEYLVELVGVSTTQISLLDFTS